MNVPLEISYHQVERTAELDDLVRLQLEKLERGFRHLSSCRVALEQSQHGRHVANPYRVRIDLTVPPGHEVVVNYETKDNRVAQSLPAVLRAAFSVARRQLQKLSELQRSDVKSHPEQETSAMVVRLFPEDDYGFLRTIDGREIYFHRRSVLNGDFIRLEVGTGVRYAEEEGDEGPQASTVEIVDKPGVRQGTSGAGAGAAEPPRGWK
jgi:cold shock CspA family protein/ribosome-associated translation inhibitor RaiA